MEQVVMLTVVGMQALKSAGELLQQILLPGLKDQSGSAGDPSSWAGKFVLGSSF